MVSADFRVGMLSADSLSGLLSADPCAAASTLEERLSIVSARGIAVERVDDSIDPDFEGTGIVSPIPI